MKELFIPYEQALALKELGFDEGCLTFYPKEGKMGFDGKYHSIKEGYKNSTVNNIWIKRYKKNFECVAAPTFSQAFKFFREKYGLYYYVTTHDSTDFEWYIYDKDQNDWEDDTTQNTHEEAEFECLKRLIQISKKGNK
jgi:hypothetical protein